MKIALVSDFYFPNVGGVQMHIHQLAKQLKSMSYQPIIITHQYPPHHIGLKQKDGILIYYEKIPFSKATNVIFATMFFQFPRVREILLKQKIDIVHCHQSSSPLGILYGLIAKYLGIKVVHTQHSLFGFQSLADIHLNRVLSILFPHYNKCIGVSRIVRNNLILRANIEPSKVTVIPNGVLIDQKQFQNIEKFNDGKIHIVVVGRLTYRRGIDLLVDLLPEFISRNQNCLVHIIGDGPKRDILEHLLINNQKMRERVQILGMLANEKTLQFVKKCHIFLNVALTESFGIALLEAAMLGLRCVSTDVGGIKEILPPHILTLAIPTKNHIISSLQSMVKDIQQKKSPEYQLKANLTYHWKDIAERNKEIYENISKQTDEVGRIAFTKQLLKQKSTFSCFTVWILFVFFLIQICIILKKKVTQFLQSGISQLKANKIENQLKAKELKKQI